MCATSAKSSDQQRVHANWKRITISTGMSSAMNHEQALTWNLFPGVKDEKETFFLSACAFIVHVQYVSTGTGTVQVLLHIMHEFFWTGMWSHVASAA